MLRIVFTVTNELVFDQRMIRICRSLQKAGYDITLIGRSYQNAPSVKSECFRQKRLYCLFRKGKLFYLEYNIRLFFFLLLTPADAITAIDLDTIVPCLLVSKIKKCRRFYDAHELFTEMKEVVSRPRIYRFWKKIEEWCLPHFQHGYTVNKPLAREFHRRYRLSYEVIQNAAIHSPSKQIDKERENTLLYQGAINEGRCFESLIPAMKTVPYKLIICGDGNFMPQLMELVKTNGVREKVDIIGKIDPDQLREITSKAKLGFTLFEHESANNYLSLANRFFDYIHAGTPQICVDFPAYREINEKHKVACLIPNTEPETISRVIIEMMTDQVKWNQMHQNCISAAPLLSWQLEEKKLIAFYKNHLG